MGWADPLASSGLLPQGPKPLADSGPTSWFSWHPSSSCSKVRTFLSRGGQGVTEKMCGLWTNNTDILALPYLPSELDVALECVYVCV